MTIPLTGVQTPMIQMLREEMREVMEKRIDERVKKDMEAVQKKSEYTLIWVSVASGFSDDVIDIARKAGVRGGTVIKGRRRSSEFASHHLGVSLQEEQEFVMIVTPTEKKKELMSAISESCGLCSEAHGVVVALPVDEAMGL